MSEQKHASLLIEEQSGFDDTESGYFDLLDTATPPTYERLKLPSEELAAAKEAFFAAGRQQNPNLRPLHIDETELLMDEADWTNFKDVIKSREMHTVAKQAYLWRINEEIGQIRMVEAASSGDMKRFRAYNKFIYGEPDPELTADTIAWFRHDAKRLLGHDNPSVCESAQAALEVLPDLDGDHRNLMPDPEVFAEIREQHFREDGYFALLFAGIEVPDASKIDTEAGDPILWQALRNLESNYKVADAPAAAWAADHGKEELQRPATYNMPFKRFVGLSGHELKHILERNNGFRQAIRLAGSGFDRYETGNEGRAVLVEQIAFPDFDSFSKQLRWQDIMRRFLAASLGWGGGAGEPLDFSKTFETINAVDRLWERKKKPDDIAAADAKADKRSWDLLATKTFVGTDGAPEAVYLKNSVYLPGNLACWKVAALNPELIEAGDLGKFDITNPRHIAMAQAFNILPSTYRETS